MHLIMLRNHLYIVKKLWLRTVIKTDTTHIRPRRRWVDNIKISLRKIGWDDMDWINQAEDRDQWRALVNTVMNLRVP
jgi:hypothetical protein